MPGLTIVALSGTFFTGTLPGFFGSLVNLTYLDVSTGPVLGLRKGFIGAGGVSEFAESLQNNSSQETLVVHDDSIDASGTEAIAHALAS
jgi:hypothetical protein